MLMYQNLAFTDHFPCQKTVLHIGNIEIKATYRTGMYKRLWAPNLRGNGGEMGRKKVREGFLLKLVFEPSLKR